jgi:hypothetical protein
LEKIDFYICIYTLSIMDLNIAVEDLYEIISMKSRELSVMKKFMKIDISRINKELINLKDLTVSFFHELLYTSLYNSYLELTIYTLYNHDN